VSQRPVSQPAESQPPARQFAGSQPAGDQPKLIPVDDHLAGILAGIRPLDPAELGLAEAGGAVLAEDVTAAHPLPSFDNSAMDGYAVRAADIAGADAGHPVCLPVAGVVAAGDTGDHAVPAGSCLRITTGARLPGGADAIVPVEWTDGGTGKVTISRAPEPGNAIRRAGEDLREGAPVLGGGTRLGPAQLGLLAAAGRGSARVRPRPRVAVFSTGNELAEPGTGIVPGQIYDSNSYMLAAAARQAGCPASRYDPVADTPEALLAALEARLPDADALITSGGVSMGGEHDVVKDVLSRIGTVAFSKVAMHPGSPQGFGVIGAPGRAPVPVFTLPGNPVSAFVSFQVFVLPALNAMQGVGQQARPGFRATLAGPVKSPPGRRSFLRGRLGRGDSGPLVTPLSGQGSHQLANLAWADTLIVVPEQVTEMTQGEVAEVIPLP
jgi:molybdopterin molybdotransferase